MAAKVRAIVKIAPLGALPALDLRFRLLAQLDIPIDEPPPYAAKKPVSDPLREIGGTSDQPDTQGDPDTGPISRAATREAVYSPITRQPVPELIRGCFGLSRIVLVISRYESEPWSRSRTSGPAEDLRGGGRARNRRPHRWMRLGPT